MEIGRIIHDQIGGNRFNVMVGVTQIMHEPNGVTFRFKARAKNSINIVRVELMPSDTYKVEFKRLRAGVVKTIEVVEDVYCEDLQEVFTETTGLYTRLF